MGSGETHGQLAGYQARIATLPEHPPTSISGLGHLSEGTLALLIPIIAIIGVLTSQMFRTHHRMRRERELLQLYHAERMAAMEKGIELPPLPPELFNDRDDRQGGRRLRASCHSRYGGLMLILVGIAVTAALWQTSADNTFWWGLVIVACGVGKLIIGLLERNDPSVNPSGNSLGSPPPSGGTGKPTYPGRG